MTTYIAINFAGKVVKETQFFSEIADYVHEHPGELDFVGVQEEGQEFGGIIDIVEFTMPYTTTKYWDCDWKTSYNHPASEEVCQDCGAHPEDMPNSLVAEVDSLLKKANKMDFCTEL